MLSHNVLPSKSLDSNAIKKTKAIFGNLSLFDGSPTYKQRRRRAASVSSSALITSTSGGPDRIRRHDKCHLRTPSTQHPTINSHSSRLAMAAVKAGFAPNQIIQPTTTMQMLQHTNIPNWSSSSSSSSADYACPLPTCGRLFKIADHLDRHMAAIHSSSLFVCNLCGKHFPRSENLALHHRREHEFDHHALNNNNNGGDNNDDDSSSPDDQRNNYNFAYQRRQQVLNHQGNNGTNGDTFYSSPRHSFDSSRSSGWSTGVVSGNGSATSNNSSRCSTLSPMLDLDFDMTDIQQPSRSTNSLNTTDSSTVNTSFYQPNNNDMYDSHMISNLVRSTSSLEDDFSSSSASSPVSTLQYDLKFNNNMTLLSPFKPIHPFTHNQQDMLQQQPMNQQVDEYQFVEDVSMLLTPTEYYAPYVDQQFTPFITSPDMNIVFGA